MYGFANPLQKVTGHGPQVGNHCTVWFYPGLFPCFSTQF